MRTTGAKIHTKPKPRERIGMNPSCLQMTGKYRVRLFDCWKLLKMSSDGETITRPIGEWKQKPRRFWSEKDRAFLSESVTASLESFRDCVFTNGSRWIANLSRHAEGRGKKREKKVKKEVWMRNHDKEKKKKKDCKAQLSTSVRGRSRGGKVIRSTNRTSTM